MLKKSGIFLYCLFALSLLVIGCGGGGGSGNPVGPTLTTGTNANLSGTVLFDNAPVPFAAVYLYKSEKAHTFGMAQLPSLKGSLAAQQIISDGAYSTTTDAAGIYSFVDIPVGQYTLIALRDENHQFVQTGVLLGQVTTLNPQLTPTGKITGKVTQTIGSVVQNIAGVFVYVNGTSYLAVTDTAGNFVISNVPANALTTSTAYEILVSSALGTASPVAGVRVNPGSTTDIGTIVVSAPPAANYANLSGSLVAGSTITSAELAGQFVVLTHQTDGTIFGTHTDATGKFQFRVMKAGTYLVLCSDSDYNYSPDPLIINIVNIDNGTVTLSAITVNAALGQNTGSIVGTVTLAGSPIAGAVVHASGTSLVGISNSAGQFVIDRVPANSSTSPYTIEVSVNMGTAPAKTGIIVTTGQVTNVGAFTITLPTTGYKTITGQFNALAPVTSGELANRLVQLTAPDGKVSAAYTDVNGAFTFITTQTGDHKLTVLDNELAYSPKTQTVTVTVLDNTIQTLGQNINVAKQDTTGSISGLVTAGGSPVTGAIISVSGTSLVGISNNAGNFIITRVPANSSSNPYALDVTSDRGISAPMTGIIVTAGADTNVGEIPLSLPVTGYRYITGQLAAVAPVTVDMLTNILIQMQAPDGTISSTYTGSTGAFSFMTAQTGSHNFIVIDSRYDYLPRSQTASVDTLDNGTQSLPNISAAKSQQNVNLSGSVNWQTPPAGWTITEGEVVLQNQPGTANLLEKRLVASISPANFRFDNVPPGSYWLSINPPKNGYQSGALSVTVIAGTDISGLSLTTTVVAPVIQATQIMDSTTVQLFGVNFSDSTQMQAIVNDRPLTPVNPWNTNAWDATRCFFNISHLPPGEYSVQLEKTLGSVKVAGNSSYFVRPVLPALDTSFVASSTDSSITFTWQNAPYVTDVQVRLLKDGIAVRPYQLISGNTITYNDLLPNTLYAIEVISTYPNATSVAAPLFYYGTKADSINVIPSYAFLPGAGTIATGTVFGFEVVSGIAYVGFDNSGPITIQAFNLSSNELLYTSSQVLTNSNHPMRSLAANSSGVYLTYSNTTASPSIAFFNSTLGAPAQTENIETRFSLGSYLDMATVRSLNDRIFLVTASGTWPTTMYLFEVDSSLNAVQTANPIAGGSNLQQKMADIAWDRTSNTLYLACPNDSNIASLRAFSAMNLTSAPQYIGDFAPSTKQILGLYANNNRVYLSQDALSYPLLTVMESVSGYVTEIYSTNPGSIGFDRQNRIWGGSLNTSFDKYYLFQYDNAMNVLQSLNIYNTDYIALNLPMVRLDESTGIMYMLHFNASNQLAAYRYNSNY